jgi:D-alanine-D-alanine ligase
MMKSYDCVVLYNVAYASGNEKCEENFYPSTIIRDEVGAVEESLRSAGLHPYILAIESFTKDLVQRLSDLSPRFVFNLCEELNGKNEQEMYVAGCLELMGIPYTGSGPFALGLALNKFYVKKVLQSFGIPTARGFVCYFGQKPAIPRGMRFPMLAKPSRQDASLGINSDSVCHNAEKLEKQIRYIHQAYEQEVLVEEYLDGREFNVSVVGDRDPEVLAISEIDFTGLPDGEPKIVSYRAKWDEESPMYSGTKPICPAMIPKRTENRIKDIAVRSYRCVGCRDYARIDMRTDARGNLNVLEVNPNPDIAPDAGFARAARAAGYSYADIILRISEAAMERGAQVPSTVYAF